MLPSAKTIGIIGGGQLGKMLIEASRPWNVKNVVLEADPDCPASKVADKVIEGSLYDAAKIRELAAVSDVLTFEIEHINSDVLVELEAEGKTIIPSPRILKVIQDKGLQKQFFESHQLPSANYVMADESSDLKALCGRFEGDKIVVKTRTGGYDGKGVQIVPKADLEEGKFVLTQPCILEQFHEGIVEYAVIVARDQDGNHTTFPLIEMYFDPVTNLVEFLFSPARVSEEVEQQCKSLASTLIDKWNGVGLFAVELFVTKTGEVLLNEVAPRPHNSGHHTIEGSYTSQFEQLNRILLGLPLGDTSMVNPAAMLNLVGPDGLSGKYQLRYADKLLSMSGVYIHLYNKAEIRPSRKMGHVTVLAPDLSSLLAKAEEVRGLIGFSAPETR